jgi:hypothetical protein
MAAEHRRTSGAGSRGSGVLPAITDFSNSTHASVAPGRLGNPKVTASSKVISAADEPSGGAFNGAVMKKGGLALPRTTSRVTDTDPASPPRPANPMMYVETPSELVARAEAAKQLVSKLKRFEHDPTRTSYELSCLA